jgi:hypothetical protein
MDLELHALEAERERAAKNQSLFREVNERINHLSESALFRDSICECLDADCTDAVPLTGEEYERLRSVSNSFFVLPGHEITRLEEVVDRTDRYLVVAKRGRGAAVAEKLDPRRRQVAEQPAS